MVAEMAGAEVSTCPGCRLVLPAQDGTTHPYIGSSTACWALFGDVLAREFQDPAYFRLYQLTVDTYAVHLVTNPATHGGIGSAGTRS